MTDDTLVSVSLPFPSNWQKDDITESAAIFLMKKSAEFIDFLTAMSQNNKFYEKSFPAPSAPFLFSYSSPKINNTDIPLKPTHVICICLTERARTIHDRGVCEVRPCGVTQYVLSRLPMGKV
jgi:hypothetical protein